MAEKNVCHKNVSVFKARVTAEECFHAGVCASLDAQNRMSEVLESKKQVESRPSPFRTNFRRSVS